MMNEMKHLERSLHEIGFDNLMIQKDIDNELHKMKAYELAIQEFKQECDLCISERNDYLKCEIIIGTQAMSFQSHLISLGSSCNLLEEKGKMLLQEISITKINLQKFSLMFKQTLTNQASVRTEFVNTYENLRDVSLNNITKNRTFIQKQKITEMREIIDRVKSDLEITNRLKYEFNITSNARIEQKHFFILIADSIFKRNMLNRKVKDRIIIFNNFERSLETIWTLPNNMINTGVSKKQENKVIEHDLIPDTHATMYKIQDSLAFKLNPQSLTGLIKGRKTSRTFKDMGFLSSGLMMGGSIPYNFNESLDLESNIKKLKLDCSENIFSLNLSLRDNRCNSKYIKKEVNNEINRKMVLVFDPGNFFTDKILTKNVKIKDKHRAITFGSFDGTINDLNEQRHEASENLENISFPFTSQSENQITDLISFKDESLALEIPGLCTNSQFKIF